MSNRISLSSNSASNSASNELNIIEQAFGSLTTGEQANLYTLSTSQGFQVKISNYGGIIVSIHAHDKQGKIADIVLGYDTVQDYEKDPYYLGAIIGRFAGRIKQGKLALNGENGANDEQYQLSINNTDNQLHGGFKALNKQLWQASTETSNKQVSLILKHQSPDGDNGFPGTVDFTVKYHLTNNNELIVEYFANTDKTTIVNLTQHSYFNLAGHKNGDIKQHLVQINAEYFLPMNEQIYPTGEIRKVKNTAHDFSQLTAIGKHIDSEDEQVQIAKGFDNYWLINQCAISGESYTAMAMEPNSGRRLTLYTDQPTMILYTSNYIDGSEKGKEHCYYQKHGAFCFEPMRVANCDTGMNINNTLLHPEQPFYSKSRYVFDCVN